MNNSTIPFCCRPWMMCSKIGLPCTLSIGLGHSLVRSPIRVPFPAARITAFIYAAITSENPPAETTLFPISRRAERQNVKKFILCCLFYTALVHCGLLQRRASWRQTAERYAVALRDAE